MEELLEVENIIATDSTQSFKPHLGQSWESIHNKMQETLKVPFKTKEPTTPKIKESPKTKKKMLRYDSTIGRSTKIKVKEPLRIDPEYRSKMNSFSGQAKDTSFQQRIDHIEEEPDNQLGTKQEFTNTDLKKTVEPLNSEEQKVKSLSQQVSSKMDKQNRVSVFRRHQPSSKLKQSLNSKERQVQSPIIQVRMLKAKTQHLQALKPLNTFKTGQETSPNKKLNCVNIQIGRSFSLPHFLNSNEPRENKPTQSPIHSNIFVTNKSDVLAYGASRNIYAGSRPKNSKFGQNQIVKRTKSNYVSHQRESKENKIAFSPQKVLENSLRILVNKGSRHNLLPVKEDRLKLFNTHQ